MNIITIIWIFTTIIITIVSIYLSIKLKFTQFNIKKIFTYLKKDTYTALFLTLAGQIGVGSIAGVALAIYIGGPGTIFWIWIITLISSILTYSESYLGVKYKPKYKKIGGPFYYIKNGLNNKYLAIIYSIILIICYIFGYNSIQANTITKSINIITYINPHLIAFILTIIIIITIKKGNKNITKITNILVPIMTIIYLSLTITIIIFNINIIPKIIINIITNALNIKSFISSFIPTMIIGIQRGIFSIESGLGTSSISASSSTDNFPTKSAYIQTISVYITSFLICTSTAIIILTTNYKNLIINNPNGIELANYAFSYHFNTLGKIILIISIFLFAYSSIISAYYFTETTANSLTNNKKINTVIKILTIITIYIGSIISPTIIWNITDILIAIITLINIYALYKLSNHIKT